MYCPRCFEVQKCKVVRASMVKPTNDGYDQRRYYPQHKDVQFFQRGRECGFCGHLFLTGEVEMGLLTELTRLREVLQEMQGALQTAAKDTQAARVSSKRVEDAVKKAGSLLLGMPTRFPPGQP